MRKKLLLMSKSLGELKYNLSIQNQELIDLAMANTFPVDSENLVGSNHSFKLADLFARLQQQQLNYIEALETELKNAQYKNQQLFKQLNSKLLELDECKRLLDDKIKKCDQSMQMNALEINAEIMKNQNRVYASLMNVNRRLEEEILSSKVKLEEKCLINKKLEARQKEQENELKQLLAMLDKLNKQGLQSEANS